MNIAKPRSQNKGKGKQAAPRVPVYTSTEAGKHSPVYGIRTASLTMPIMPTLVIGDEDNPAPAQTAAACCNRGRLFQESVSEFARAMPVHMRELFAISLNAAYRKMDAEVPA